MSGSLFTPKLKQTVEAEDVEVEVPAEMDATAKRFHTSAQYLMVMLLGVLPLVFMPGIFMSASYTKIMFVVGVVSVALFMISLLMLRQKQVRTVLPVSLGIFWAFVLVMFASGVISGDTQDAIRGSFLEPQTSSFWLMAALVMTLTLTLQSSKIMTIRSIVLFAASAGIVLLYMLARELVGVNFLTFGAFPSLTSTPVGSFNDLALFSGLVTVLSLVTLAQLPLRAMVQYFLLAIISLALVQLSVANFTMVWVVIGFFSLLMFVFHISKDTLFQSASAVPTSRTLIVATALVAIVSGSFIVAGDYLGAKVSEVIDVNYVEVRPSLEATIDIASAVYDNGDAMLGIGANRFTDAWRLYKDTAINETVFWDTDFSAGSSLVSTLFVTTGVLGGALFVLFHLGLLYVGYRSLLRNQRSDSYWQYLGVFSFTAVAFLWGLSYVYVPGVTMLLLAVFFTGLLFVSSAALLPASVKRIPLASNQSRGFMLMTVSILVIVVCVTALMSVSSQYQAQVLLVQAQTEAENLEEFDSMLSKAYGLYNDDRFLVLIAQAYVAEMNTMMQVRDLSKEEEQQVLLKVAERALAEAEAAVKQDFSNSRNHAVLAAVYSNLASLNIDPALGLAESSLENARRFDPVNPGYRLMVAQLSARAGDIEKAQSEIVEALKLKRNYTDALYLSAQLDIAEGKVESAISTTRAIITLEPNNPTRYFQLGILLASNDKVPESIAAYRAAISLDPNYANARYLLALSLVSIGQKAEAVEHLRFVEQYNQENNELRELIQKIESGEDVLVPGLGLDTPVSDSAPSAVDETVVTTGDVQSDLITSVNTIPATSEEESVQPEVEPAVTSEEDVE
ncbi:tetratricopeptide repeat protein [Candidatus Kaiserbacteria bacterium]|nr:tetratricopeptide repeat protein [Candidatus Kaiserbacteria bacterium]